MAYCHLEKKGRQTNLRLWQAEALGASAGAVHPGKVIAESAEGIDIACGEGVLRVTELQAEGKRRMSAGDFLNANSLAGQVLG